MPTQPPITKADLIARRKQSQKPKTLATPTLPKVGDTLYTLLKKETKCSCSTCFISIINELNTLDPHTVLANPVPYASMIWESLTTSANQGQDYAKTILKKHPKLTDHYYRDFIHRACEICKPFLENIKPTWSIGITVSKRTDDTLFPQTLNSLHNAGWLPEETTIFLDGEPLEVPEEYSLVHRVNPAGALANFYLALSELVLRFPQTDYYLLSQDDVLYAKNIRQFLETKIPNHTSIIKLFTDHKCETGESGWYPIPKHKDMRGAQSYIFPNASAISFLQSNETLAQRLGTYRENQAIDNVVARWARKEKAKTQWCHSPSLTQHIGRKASTLGHDDCEASTFPGIDFDATQLNQSPSVTAVMITGHGQQRTYLAQMSVQSFRNQTYKNRKLLILRDDGESVYGKTFKPKPNEFEIQVPAGMPLGELRNKAIEETNTKLIIQWDDDDFSSPERIAEQVKAWSPGKCVVLANQIRVDLLSKKAIIYHREAGIWGTILHETHTKHRYPLKQKGEDTDFLNAFPKHQQQVLNNTPSLYVRTYHGDNTWHQSHIMERPSLRRLNSKEQTLVDTLCDALLNPTINLWKQHQQNIRGWFSGRLIKYLELINQLHKEQHTAGNILEIGVHHGRSLIPLYSLAQESEKVIGIDPMIPDEHYKGFEQLTTNLNLCLQDQSKLILKKAKSIEVTPEEIGTHSCRILHLDGSHYFDDVLHDLRFSEQVLSNTGILLVDDVINDRWTEVNEAFRTWLHTTEWQPFAFAYQRMFCCHVSQRKLYIETFLPHFDSTRRGFGYTLLTHPK